MKKILKCLVYNCCHNNIEKNEDFDESKYHESIINFYTPLPEGGGGYTVLPLSVRPSKIFFVTFFLSNC